jgi:hypothetical protein
LIQYHSYKLIKMINLTVIFHLFTKQMENYIQSRYNLKVRRIKVSVGPKQIPVTIIKNYKI